MPCYFLSFLLHNPMKPTMPAPKRSIMTSPGIGIRLIVRKLKLKASASRANIKKQDKPNKLNNVFNFAHPLINSL